MTKDVEGNVSVTYFYHIIPSKIKLIINIIDNYFHMETALFTEVLCLQAAKNKIRFFIILTSFFMWDLITLPVQKQLLKVK